MAARFENRLIEHATRLVAVLIFVFAQSIASAHAEGESNAHDSDARCEICCIAVADGDADAPNITCALDENRKPAKNNLLPQTQFIAIRCVFYSSVRGPPCY